MASPSCRVPAERPSARPSSGDRLSARLSAEIATLNTEVAENSDALDTIDQLSIDMFGLQIPDRTMSVADINVKQRMQAIEPVLRAQVEAGHGQVAQLQQRLDEVLAALHELKKA